MPLPPKTKEESLEFSALDYAKAWIDPELRNKDTGGSVVMVMTPILNYDNMAELFPYIQKLYLKLANKEGEKWKQVVLRRKDERFGKYVIVFSRNTEPLPDYL